MIPFSEAKSRVLDQVRPVSETEGVPVAAGLGRVLAETAVASQPVPNHDNSAMDGYAVRFEDLSETGEVALDVVADLPAGDRLTTTLKKGEAVRIMTGAPIPDGADCIIIQEVVKLDGNRLTVPPGARRKQHIRPAGEDIAAGTEVLPRGRRLGPADLGLLTSLGAVEITVFRRVKVALLSTGNEVFEPGEPLKPGQVYDSNRSALRGALERMGVEVLDLGLVRDDRAAIEAAFQRGGAEADAVISTGGVSVGDYDLVKEVLKNNGEIDFWKVSMKPGNPQAYGRLGRAHFFGLPGNPVSGVTVFLLIVRHALLKMMGAAPEPEQRFQATLRGGWKKKHGRMDFLRGVVRFDGERPSVEPTGAQGSGILTSLSRANAFIILPEGPVELADGDTVTVQMIHHG